MSQVTYVFANNAFVFGKDENTKLYFGEMYRRQDMTKPIFACKDANILADAITKIEERGVIIPNHIIIDVTLKDIHNTF